MEYKSDTDTVRITANGDYGDPQILIKLDGIGSSNGAWANEFGYLIIFYRTSKTATGEVYVSYTDSSGGEQDYQGYNKTTTTLTGVPAKELTAANTSYENNFHYIEYNLTTIPGCQHNP